MNRLLKKRNLSSITIFFHNAPRFDASVNEDQERLLTFYWLPKLHKQPYKARFIANSNSMHDYRTIEIANLLYYYHEKSC